MGNFITTKFADSGNNKSVSYQVPVNSEIRTSNIEDGKRVERNYEVREDGLYLNNKKVSEVKAHYAGFAALETFDYDKDKKLEPQDSKSWAAKGEIFGEAVNNKMAKGGSGYYVRTYENSPGSSANVQSNGLYVGTLKNGQPANEIEISFKK